MNPRNIKRIAAKAIRKYGTPGTITREVQQPGSDPGNPTLTATDFVVHYVVNENRRTWNNKDEERPQTLRVLLAALDATFIPRTDDVLTLADGRICTIAEVRIQEFAGVALIYDAILDTSQT